LPEGKSAARLPPAWAYPVKSAGFQAAPDDGKPRQVQGSSASYSVAQTRDRFLAPDWHPAEHPVMPEIVAKGRSRMCSPAGFLPRRTARAARKNAGLPASASYIKQADGGFQEWHKENFRARARAAAVDDRAGQGCFRTRGAGFGRIFRGIEAVAG